MASCTLDASLTAGPSRSSAPRVSTFRRTPELRPRDGHHVPASRTKVLYHNSSCACRCSARHTSVSPARAHGPALLRPPNTYTHRQLSRVTACTLASPARRRSHSCRSSTCTGSSARELLHCRNHAAPTLVLARRQFTCIGRISSCRSCSRQLSCGRHSCALVPRIHSSCAAQLLLAPRLLPSRAPTPACRHPTHARLVLGPSRHATTAAAPGSALRRSV
jgi:hypothetical protein